MQSMGLQGKRGMVEGRDVPWMLRQWVERRPNQTFLVWEPTSGVRRTWTYAQFDLEVRQLAAGLAARGVTPGSRVLIHLENSPEFLLSWFACAHVSAVAVCTNTRSVAAELQYFLSHTRVVAAITQPALVGRVLDAGVPLTFIVLAEDDSGVITDPSITDTELVAFSDLYGDAARAGERPADPWADLAIQFTSGTTSRSKAVVFTHANAVWAAQVNAANFKLDGSDVTLIQLPLYHINALSYLMWSTLWVGGVVVLQPRVSISSFWDVSVRNGCTVASVLSFAAEIMAGQPVPAHNYRLWIFGVAHPEWEGRFGIRFLPFWGMTETISAGIVGDLSHPGPFMCMGRQAPGYEISIRQDGKPIAPGGSGQLYVRGERGVSLFKEYLDAPDANRDSFDRDGWFDTGDLVRVDAEGNLFFGDRVKDVIRVGGENVSASEVERVVAGSGLVKECAVVARKHPVLGEVPVVFVVPLAQDLGGLRSGVMAACQTNLADFKVVRQVIVIDALPRNTLGKVDKKLLRERAVVVPG